MDNHYVKRVTEGDTEAFRFLVEKYQDRALSAAYRVIKDRDLAEDIVQESFIKAYKNLGTFRGDASFATWFLRIVVNESIRHIRRKKLEAAYTQETLSINEVEMSNSLKTMKEEEQRRFIDRAMHQLPPREALVLQLFYIDDLSLKEMEEVMELKADHLKVLLHRARKSIFTILQTELKHELISLL
ncbi:MAG: sigma-70 family RNA polymerase sigma factor [Salinivirgaceae bacterium]|nr:sigma-70 family RNA polymerase sigma factor [Salinivirgaceae bacterium]